jgi:hypothetical protein
MPQQGVKHRRAALANVTPAPTGTVQQLEPVRFHLEKILAARELFPGAGVGAEGQTLFGVGLDFFEQILHGRISWEQNTLKASRCHSLLRPHSHSRPRFFVFDYGNEDDDDWNQRNLSVGSGFVTLCARYASPT